MLIVTVSFDDPARGCCPVDAKPAFASGIRTIPHCGDACRAETVPIRRFEPRSLSEPYAMTWSYSQSTGALSHNGEFIDTGYSGHGDGFNNPNAQDDVDVGPLPQGNYTIGAVEADGGRLGPYVMPLQPDAANRMFGRNGFFIHGDNRAMNNTASDGCIILSRLVRTLIAQSGDTNLTVVG
jgi:hypothetical protein